MQDEILEAVRNPFFWLYVTFFLSICVVSGSAQQLGEAVELDFQAFRMQQYEVNGNMYGSKNFKVQYEAVSLDGAALRRCIVAQWRDVATRDIDDILAGSVGALLIIVPADLDALVPADRTLFQDMEKRLATVKSDLAIYITPSSSDINTVLSDLSSSSGKAVTATQQLVNSIAANTFQFTSTGTPSATPLTYSPRNVIGRLKSADNVPTIAFVAHYDSHSVFPGASPSADSNGSGIVTLLELLAVLSRFYENASTRPPYNLLFAWTAGGKYNYQGSRQLIENIQTSPKDDQERVQLTVCVEAVGGHGKLYMHAGKQPAEGSAAHQLLQRLKAASPNQSVELVTKKISLNAPQLSWEHERFNIKRMAAVTLSRLPSPDDIRRRSLLDTTSQISLDALENNVRTIAEAMLGYMLALPEAGFSNDTRISADSSLLAKDAVDRQRLAHFVRQFASRPRSMADEAATKAVTANIMEAVKTLSKHASFMPVQLQEVQVWGGTVDKLLAEKVKPAVFELFIATGVIGYLSVVYYVVCNAQRFIEGTVAFMKKRV